MQAKLDRKDIESMKYNDVKKLVKDMSLDVSGSKQDIIDRICAIDVEIDDPTEEEMKMLNENATEETQESKIEQEETTTPENQNDAQIEENEQKTESEEKEEDEPLVIDGVLKVIYKGQVRLRRTPHYENDNVVKLEPNGAIFRVVAIVKNELGQSFYQLSNGAYIAKDDKLVEFKLG